MGERRRNRSRSCSRAPKNIPALTQSPAPVQGINKQTQITNHEVKETVFLPFSVSVAGKIKTIGVFLEIAEDQVSTVTLV